MTNYTASGRKALPPVVIPDVSGMTCKDAAHAYLNAGLWPIPWRVYKGKKMPCYRKGWSYDSIPRETHETIDKWNPKWQVGLITSRRSGVLAADVDHPDDFDAWDIPSEPPVTVSSDTGREGGYHLVYDGRELSEEEWPKQGDIPGGQVKTNGFIGVEPSIHPNGKPYRWGDDPRTLAPVGGFAKVLADYRRKPVANGNGPEEPVSSGDLWQAVLDAKDSKQYGAIFEWSSAAHKRGVTDDEILSLLWNAVRDGEIRSWRPGDPWDRDGLRLAAIPEDGWKHEPNSRWIMTEEESDLLRDIAMLGLPLLFPGVLRMIGPDGGWYDFTALISGKAKRPEPEVCRRADNVPLFYIGGKEHNVYGETEAGKDMLIDYGIIKECLERTDSRLSVMEIDFEEGDGIDVGSRLLNMGLDPDLLNDTDWFRYSTPATPGEAHRRLTEVLRLHPDIVIFNGVSAAYALNGWQIKENDSWGEFRATYISPCLHSGISTVSTDHVPKDTDGSNKYALGGVNKLNMASGTGYLLKAVSDIVRGGEGRTKILLTKDRPGGVRPKCVKTKTTGIREAGLMVVKSVGDGPGELSIEILPPIEKEDQKSESDGFDVPGSLMEKISVAIEHFGEYGVSQSVIARAYKGDDARKVSLAISRLIRDGYVAEITTRKLPGGYLPIRSVKPWRRGTDEVILLSEEVAKRAPKRPRKAR